MTDAWAPIATSSAGPAGLGPAPNDALRGRVPVPLPPPPPEYRLTLPLDRSLESLADELAFAACTVLAREWRSWRVAAEALEAVRPAVAEVLRRGSRLVGTDADGWTLRLRPNGLTAGLELAETLAGAVLDRLDRHRPGFTDRRGLGEAVRDELRLVLHPYEAAEEDAPAAAEA